MEFKTIYIDPPDKTLDDADYLVMSVIFEEEDWEELSLSRDALEYDSLYLGQSEFQNVRNKWRDPYYLRDFYREHISYFQTPYWDNISEERFVSDVAASRPAIFSDFQNACQNHLLDNHFEPFSKTDKTTQDKNHIRNKHRLVRLKSKYGYIADRIAFRLYAIEIDFNCYIVTGGVIKTVEEMHQAPSTNLELLKLDYVYDTLRNANVNSKKSLLEALL